MIKHPSRLIKTLTLLSFSVFLVSAGCGNTSGKQETKAPQPKSAGPDWVLLFDGETLDGWEVTQFGTQGPVQVSGGSIVLGMGDGCSGITWKGEFPKMNYEVKLEAKKVTGNDFFCGMTFPVGNSFCSFIAGGWGGPVVGLSSIDGLDASENETRTLKKFEHDTWYNIHLKVSEKKIEAWIDGEQIVDFSYEGRKLSIRPEVELSKPFGICSWITTAALRNIQLKKE
ncbi:MAG: 3-keto-disaccharide hydrolase [Mariniphaga sp.]